MTGVGPGVVTADLHGKTAYQAKVTADALLRRADRSVYRIRLVHGCHGGTALRDFLRSEYGHRSGVLRLEVSPDGGTTELILREYVR